MEKDLINKSKTAEREEEILEFWKEKKIFEKSLEKESPKGEFVFYDGPPFATGLPHYGNLLAGTIKDYVGRYRTMRGYHVPRKWGWDTHGLPIENIVEQEIGLKAKKDIEEFGVEKFNDIARTKVFTYADNWKKIIPRMGRFVDMEDDYRTLSPEYMETVMWVFKELYKKGLVYEGFKSMHYCPHCGTPLANFEVSQGYKDITDISVTAKFELENEPGTFFLAWTTTPWTLPGNVALAINPEIDYTKIKIGEEKYILADARKENVLKDQKYEIIEKIKGEKLVGISYKPLFNYYENEDLKNKENGWKVYPANFVTIEDGTGIVHIAPAFGDDDYNLGREHKLPFIQHVAHDGAFKKEITDFAGKKVKPKGDHQASDIEVLKFLSAQNKIFSKEKFTHSYPHCYRCDTPLLNYAMSSWYVEVSKFRDDLVEANKKVSWIPKEIGENRFGDWLANSRDWAVSRFRFWGTPLPIWKCQKEGCKEIEFLGSLAEIKERTNKKNKIFAVRHGEAESNVKEIINSDPKSENHLTELGIKQAGEAGENLKDKNIDIIYASPFMRTKETAEIIADKIGYEKEKIIFDERLHEIYAGVLDGKTDKEYQEWFHSEENKFKKAPEGGEDYVDVKKRMTEFLYEIYEKNEGKNILIVSHKTPIFLMFAGVKGLNTEQTIHSRTPGVYFIKNSEIKELEFSPIPHNRNYELDFHRPFIDEIHLKCSCGGIMKRIQDVFDCWFESGAMPYAQEHYPFENLDKFNPEKGKGFPADFIAEGLDQTRGWFYTMIIIGVALYGKSPYKNVIVNGIILADDGQKMSKHLKNYPDPMEFIEKYSVDALRYFMLSSPLMKAEDLKFSEKGVDEVSKKVLMRLQNVYTFFEMYGGFDVAEKNNFESKNILDKWIIARLKEVVSLITYSTDKYELDRATRPIADFVDDISTWFLRRSRDRFKSDDTEDRESAILTTKIIIENFAKVIAPVMPFIADDLYLKITGGMKQESVHLESWPEEFVGVLNKEDEEIIENMKETRKIVSLGLEARTKAGIKVRQPLKKLKVKSEKLKENTEYAELIKDEVNVKEVFFDEGISVDVEIDTEITEVLKEEGIMRDLIRAIQEMRKENKLNPEDKIIISISANEFGQRIINSFEEEIKKTTGIKEINNTKDAGKEIEIENAKFSISIIK